MENVIQLSEYRKSAKKNVAAQPDTAPHYFCQRCDTDKFKLYASGLVHCAHCSALMRNIGVTTEPNSRGGTGR